MQTILILAGRSRRFWPLSEKPLFPVCGKPLLGHQLDRLKKAGCTDILLVASAENTAQVAMHFPKLRTAVQENDTMGIHHALLAALPHCGKGPVMIVSSNDFIEPSAYKTLIAEAKKKGVDGALLAQKVDSYFPGGYLTVERGRITGIVEKPGAGNEPSKLVNIVAHIHNDSSALLGALKKSDRKADDGYERALDGLLKSHRYHAVPYEGMWRAVKYPWHLLHLLPVFLGEIKKPSIHKSAKIHKTAVVDGNVVIGPGVRVLPHATVAGPCVIGAGTIIGNNALVRGSSVGEQCVIGYNTEVKGSILAGPVWTHMTYLGDTIVGSNVSFGGGCVTGNLRLDEGEIASKDPGGDTPLPTGLTKFGSVIGDGCRFGIQVGINPGVKVGMGTFVTGGLTLSQDVPDASFVTIKDGKVEVRQNRTAAPGMEGRAKYFR